MSSEILRRSVVLFTAMRGQETLHCLMHKTTVSFAKWTCEVLFFEFGEVVAVGQVGFLAAESEYSPHRRYSGVRLGAQKIPAPCAVEDFNSLVYGSECYFATCSICQLSSRFAAL